MYLHTGILGLVVYIDTSKLTALDTTMYMCSLNIYTIPVGRKRRL